MIIKKKQTHGGFFTAIFIGVGAIVGSGWLFASYYASRMVGPAAIISWILGAVIAMMVALLLAEIATMFPITGLFSRLLVVSHNRDIGFVIAISNWVCVILMIPSEAEATAQYISTVFPNLTKYLFVNHAFAPLGLLLSAVLVVFYALVNYWGLKSLGKINNVITVIKILVPTLTALIFIFSSFIPSHFTGIATGGFMPYGITSIFGAVVSCGIFYAFYGFQYIAAFSSEFKNPSKTIPIALVGSVLICLIIYILLQVSFIGALPYSALKNGWGNISFTSPLAQLAGLLGLNFLAVVLYADACISPSGTGFVYLGSASRMLTGMSKDGQFPKYFGKNHAVYNVSRSALILITIFCIIMVFFFKSWQRIVELVTVFQLLSCIAVPIAFYRLRIEKRTLHRPFRLKFGVILSFLIFILMTYLLTLANFEALVANFIIHLICFTIFVFFYYKSISERIRAVYSSWSIFLYMIFLIALPCFRTHQFYQLHSLISISLEIFVAIIFFFAMVCQKNYNKKEDISG